jgi:hypothetical protein
MDQQFRSLAERSTVWAANSLHQIDEDGNAFSVCPRSLVFCGFLVSRLTKYEFLVDDISGKHYYARIIRTRGG